MEKEENKEIQEEQKEKKDVLADYRNEDGTLNEEKIIKLSEDKLYYRQQLSKLKQLPSSIEDYGKDFVLDSKFQEFASKEENQEKIKTLFEKIDKLSMEKGIGVERNHDIRRFVMDELVEAKAIDLKTDAEREEENQKVIEERNKAVQEAIGEVSDINAWNKNLCEWLKGFCNSDSEYEMHKALLERNSLWALSLNKVRHAMQGSRIPVAVSDSTYNETEWRRAFSKADRETQDKMLEERAKILLKNRK